MIMSQVQYPFPPVTIPFNINCFLWQFQSGRARNTGNPLHFFCEAMWWMVKPILMSLQPWRSKYTQDICLGASATTSCVQQQWSHSIIAYIWPSATLVQNKRHFQGKTFFRSGNEAYIITLTWTIPMVHWLLQTCSVCITIERKQSRF